MMHRSRPWAGREHRRMRAGKRRFSPVRRALKKSAFWAVFAFDLPKTRTYNPRPRCFAAPAKKWC
jgi:hypothetical protein